jgi:hypothetical protein
MWEDPMNAKSNSMQIADFYPVITFIAPVELEGYATLRVTKDPMLTAVDEATFARLSGSDFKNGVIKCKVLSSLLSKSGSKSQTKKQDLSQCE